MVKPNFTYPGPHIDASKLAYDLALIYAQTKFEDATAEDQDFFASGPAPKAVEEMAFIQEKFMQAYEYYIGSESGDLERQFNSIHG